MSRTDNLSSQLVFGKNTVLAFLNQESKTPTNSHQTIQSILVDEAIKNANLAAKITDDEALKEFEHKINQAIKKLKTKNLSQEKRLHLPALTDIKKPAGAKINRIFVADNIASDTRVEKIKNLAQELVIPLVVCERKKLDQIAGQKKRHQGVVALMSPAELWSLDTFLQKLALDKIIYEFSGQSMDGYTIAVLDGIEDPHNLGAIIRVAESAGLKAIFIPQHRTASITGTIAKTSSGALAHLPIVKVGNLVHCLETLKKHGFWVAALDLAGKEFYTNANLVCPLVIVIGGEGTGVSRLVKEHCDFLLKIPMLGKTESLNASVAAGIMFYEVVRQCQQSKQQK